MALDFLSEKNRAPGECSIVVDGDEIVDLYPFLLEMAVESSRTEAATATLSFETRRNELGEWTVQDAGVFVTWASVKIVAHFGDYEEEVLRGYIREISVEAPQDAGAARVKVVCQDESYKLDRPHERKSWGKEDDPYSDTRLLAEILGAHGLSPDGENADGQDGLINVAQDDTDIKFLKSRADYNGYELIFREGTVYFGPMRLEADAQDTIYVYAGDATNCLSFNVRTDGHQPDAVAYDVPAESGSTSTQEIVYPDLKVLGTSHVDSLDAGLGEAIWKLSAEAGASAERMHAVALQKINDIDIHRVQAEGELDGTLYGHVLKPGLPVAVDGVGVTYNGIYYVDAVSHSFTSQGYRQKFKLLRNALGDNLDTVPTVSGIADALLALL